MSNLNFFTQEREQAILKLLNDKGRITVAELVDIFQISATTIRRQLNYMDKKGVLLRTHGGAMCIDEVSFERPLGVKYIDQSSEKKLIAREARKHIRNGDIISLGGGTTILELAKLLHDVRDLIVITNSLPTAVELYTNRNIEVQICGGTIREKTGVVIGSTSNKFLEDIYSAKTFVGADSVSIEFGLTTPNRFEAQIEKQLIQHGKVVYVLADSTKMDKVTLTKQTPLSDIDYIITDCGITPEFKQKLIEKSVHVLIPSIND